MQEMTKQTYYEKTDAKIRWYSCYRNPELGWGRLCLRNGRNGLESGI